MLKLRLVEKPMKTTDLALGALLSAVPMMLGCATVTDDEPGETPGTGGTGDAAVVQLACEESTSFCTNGQIDPIERDEGCLVADPPVLPDACDGTESLDRPLSCAQTGNAIVYRFTSAQIADDCNLGYDLDGCNGNSCALGENAPGEGMGGVDNAIAGLAPLATTLDTNLGVVNQALYDELCESKTVVRFAVDANPEQNCATVTTFIDDQLEGTVLLNLSDTGCLSGELGVIPLEIAGTVRSLDNAVGRLTMSESGFANGIVGVTLDQATATTLATRLIGALGSTLVVRLLDIDEDLDGDPLVACNALSVTLRVGGAAEAPTADP
jgi:hypothetical protein